jgi:glyceraldehyde 3-phosphate dehydrogenase
MSKTKIAINGYGRIGQCILRALYERRREHQFDVVAVNDTASPETVAHLAKYDTTHGVFNGNISIENDCMIINNHPVRLFSDRNPRNLPWGELDVDVVMECTGAFTTKESAKAHLDAGAKKVIISAPGGSDVDQTIVYGVNQQDLTSDMEVVSNASCTTNCLAPVAKPLNDRLGIESGTMLTVHAYTNDQHLLDAKHKDIRRARSATQSMIPTKTGAAQAVGLVLPELQGKLNGFAMRVPTPNVSVVDFTFIAERETNADEINRIIYDAQNNELKGVLGYNTEALVSVDFNHDAHPSVFDATQTRVNERLVKVLAWYDNEWGFSCQMIRTAKAWMNAK